MEHLKPGANTLEIAVINTEEAQEFLMKQPARIRKVRISQLQIPPPCLPIQH